MPALPTTSNLTGSSVTEAQFKSELSNLISYLSGLLGTAGSNAVALSVLGSLLNNVATIGANYTIVPADRGKLFDCTAACTLIFTAAATLGNGFSVGLRNSSTGNVIVDPNLSELIDGAGSITLLPGESCLVICSGTALKTVGRISSADGVLRSIQKYTAGSNTWTKPTGLKRIKITVVGGGAAGVSGSGGGAGGASIKLVEAGSLAFNETVTVGAGSTSGAGGTSSFGTHATASGGQASGGYGAAGGAGGIGAGGLINLAGGAGGGSPGGSSNTAFIPGGCGGNSIFGGGGGGGGAVNTGAGGGGGGYAGNPPAYGPDGAGAAGIVIVEEYF